MKEAPSFSKTREKKTAAEPIGDRLLTLWETAEVLRLTHIIHDR